MSLSNCFTYIVRPIGVIEIEAFDGFAAVWWYFGICDSYKEEIVKVCMRRIRNLNKYFSLYTGYVEST